MLSELNPLNACILLEKIASNNIKINPDSWRLFYQHSSTDQVKSFRCVENVNNKKNKKNIYIYCHIKKG